MNILVVNCGSSSLKLRLLAVDGPTETALASGEVEAIGPQAKLSFLAGGAELVREGGPVADWSAALERLLAHLREAVSAPIDAVGHRVVNGGAYVQPTLIEDSVVRGIEAAIRFAPLHNGPSLEGIRAARAHLPGIPMVAVFDTAFHATMPPVAAQYALPEEVSRRHGLRRYGYHGIAHRSMTERYAELARVPPAAVSIVTLQLGNGCSATAVRGGASVDTSMGFTPLEGLMMGTRSGDIDPAAVTYLLRQGGMSPDEVEVMLNHRSGLLGVSGTSGDMAALLGAGARGDERAGLAIDMFCYRVRKYVGAYLAVLGRARAVVFGGGIGEHAPEIRRRICEPLEALGLHIDTHLNESLRGREGRFSAEGSPIEAWVIPSDEERIIARDAFSLLSTPPKETSP